MREEGGERREGGRMSGEAEREGSCGGAVDAEPPLGDQRNGGGG